MGCTSEVRGGCSNLRRSEDSKYWSILCGEGDCDGGKEEPGLME